MIFMGKGDSVQPAEALAKAEIGGHNTYLAFKLCRPNNSDRDMYCDPLHP